MHIHRSAVELVIQAPAKLNLFFEVLAKRSDGYHEIETLMCPIDLYDTLHFQEDPGRAGGVAVPAGFRGQRPSGRGLDEVPEGPDNLVVRAVELVRRRAGFAAAPSCCWSSGFRRRRDWAADRAMPRPRWWPPTKAGGSAGRATSWPHWAAELGSDVPFFLAGGPAICRGRGEGVEPVAGLGALCFVVVYPPEGWPTAAVYGRVGRPPRSRDRSGRCSMHCSEETGDRRAGGCGIGLQPAAERLSPWVKRLQQEFAQLDCLGHGMSGSGSSYFGLYRHARHARRSARRLQAKGFGAVFAVRSCR